MVLPFLIPAVGAAVAYYVLVYTGNGNESNANDMSNYELKPVSSSYTFTNSSKKESQIASIIAAKDLNVLTQKIKSADPKSSKEMQKILDDTKEQTNRMIYNAQQEITKMRREADEYIKVEKEKLANIVKNQSETENSKPNDLIANVVKTENAIKQIVDKVNQFTQTVKDNASREVALNLQNSIKEIYSKMHNGTMTNSKTNTNTNVNAKAKDDKIIEEVERMVQQIIDGNTSANTQYNGSKYEKIFKSIKNALIVSQNKDIDIENQANTKVKLYANELEKKLQEANNAKKGLEQQLIFKNSKTNSYSITNTSQVVNVNSKVKQELENAKNTITTLKEETKLKEQQLARQQKILENAVARANVVNNKLNDVTKQKDSLLQQIETLNGNASKQEMAKHIAELNALRQRIIDDEIDINARKKENIETISQKVKTLIDKLDTIGLTQQSINAVINDSQSLGDIVGQPTQAHVIELTTILQKLKDGISKTQNGGKKKIMTGGLSKSANIKDIVPVLQLYCDIVKKYIKTHIMRYITSLSYEDLNSFQTFLKDDKNTNIDKDTFLKTLYSFLYIDISGIDNIQDAIFNSKIKDKYLSKDAILRDTSNRMKIEKTNVQSTDKQYIYINSYISMIEYMLMPQSYLTYDKILKRVFLHVFNNYAILITFANNFHQHIEDKKRNNGIINEITKKLHDKINNSVLTYIKLRVDNPKFSSYSKRFRVFTNFNKHDVYDMKYNTLLVKYNDHNFPYYDNNGNELPTSQLNSYYNLFNNAKSYFNENKPLTTQELKYEDEYVFGHFTNIFRPQKNNKQIAQDMDDVKDKLQKGKPVFIIGYGASGAGKTSTLIYYNKETEYDKQNGVLIHLCDLMAEDGYDNIQVKTYEFYNDKNNKYVQRCTPQCKSTNASQKSYLSFSYKNKKFVLNEDYTHTNTFIERSKETQTTFKQGCNLGQFIIHMIDTDRYVRATTNNPNSSRSHTLVFVKFINTSQNKETTLIVGDFAGVENAFDCENDDILGKFLNIKQDDGSGNLFYNNTTKLGGSKRKIKGGTSSVDCVDYISNNQPFYTFGRKPITHNYDSKFFKASSVYNNLRLMIANTILANNDNPPFDRTKLMLSIKPNANNESYKTIINILKEFLKEITTKSLNKSKNEILQDKELKEIFFKIVGSKLDINTLFKESSHIIVRTEDNGDIPFCTGIDYDKNGKNIAYLKSISPFLNCLFTSKYKMTLTGKIPESISQKIPEKIKSNPLTPHAVYQMLNYVPIDRDVEKNIELITVMKERWLQGIKDSKYSYKPSRINFNDDIDHLIPQLYVYVKHEQAPIRNTTEDIQDLWSEKIYQYQILAKESESEITKKHISIYDISNKWKALFSNPIFSKIFGLSFSKDQYTWFCDVYNAVINTLINDDNTVIDDIQKYMDKYNELIEDIILTVPDQFIEYNCKKKFGQNVCTIRTNEGKYINSSLNQIRDVIKSILYEKNKDSISMSPLIVGNCLQHYCNYLDCFTMSKSSHTKSDIFDVIQKELQKELKEIVISVFCVLNLSEKANNPPPVPYINTNSVWYYINNVQLQNDYKNNLGKELALLKHKITEQFSLIPLKHKIGVSIDINQHVLDSFIKTVDTYPSTTFNDETKNIIVNMLNEIDKINAASAMGTLQFVDSLAKFNTTNVLCAKKTVTSRSNQSYIEDIENLNLHDVVFANEDNPQNRYVQGGGKKKSKSIKKTVKNIVKRKTNKRSASK